MTMLASWVGVDTHGPASAYIVTDSRISWENGRTYDHGKKVFASVKYPEIFGYAGDVLFPSVVLSQIVCMIDEDILFDSKMSCREKNAIVFNKISYELNKYPIDMSRRVFQIIHISRDTDVRPKVYPSFYLYYLSYENGRWSRREKAIPRESGVIDNLGSGKIEFEKNYKRYQDGKNKNTSRNVFHCFIDTLDKISDPNCGGAPQLVGIYRKPQSNGQYFGIIYKGKCYFAGTEVPKCSHNNQIEWRNENFEICDGIEKTILNGAQQQPDLLRLI